RSVRKKLVRQERSESLFAPSGSLAEHFRAGMTVRRTSTIRARGPRRCRSTWRDAESTFAEKQTAQLHYEPYPSLRRRHGDLRYPSSSRFSNGRKPPGRGGLAGPGL